MAFSRLEKAMALIIGIDITTPGTSRALARQLVTRIAPLTVPAAAAAGPFVPAAIGAGLGYAALQTDPGQQLLEAAAERGRQDRIRLERKIQDTLALAPIKRKRRMTKFNRSVKAGMKIIKDSTSYGKKGVINAPKKAFGAVNKVISNVNKGKKITAKGVLRKVALRAKKIIGKPKPRKTYIGSLRKRLRIRK
jgi:predicted transglutaminase-like cysteine proteinase